MRNECTALDSDRLPNCLIANIVGGAVCQQCLNDTFINVGGNCILKSQFPECQVFDTSLSLTGQNAHCITCALGFFMGEGCVPIDQEKFPNCGRLNVAGTECVECN